MSRLVVAAVSAQGPSTPGFRVRVLLFLDELASRGVHVAAYPLFSEPEARAFYGAPLARRLAVALPARRRLRRTLRELGRETSVTLIQRQADVLPTMGLERLAHGNRRLVWDVDDAIWSRSAERRVDPIALVNRMSRKVERLAGRADHVIAANRVLASWLRPVADKITVIPSVVETRGLPVRAHGEGRELVVGWLGSFSTAPYLRRVGAALTRLGRAVPDLSLSLLVVGGSPPHVEGVRVEAAPWSVRTEREALARMDIGLMPLPDNEWTRGKSAHKAIQYMAAGIPVVADDVGIAREVVGDGEAGYAVAGDDGWVEALAALARDAGLRAELGRRGRVRAEREYSVERWAPVLASILRAG